jgi:hypothetical protein
MTAVFGPARGQVAATTVDAAGAPSLTITAAPLRRMDMRISPLLFEPVKVPVPQRQDE